MQLLILLVIFICIMMRVVIMECLCILLIIILDMFVILINVILMMVGLKIVISVPGTQILQRSMEKMLVKF